MTRVARADTIAAALSGPITAASADRWTAARKRREFAAMILRCLQDGSTTERRPRPDPYADRQDRDRDRALEWDRDQRVYQTLAVGGEWVFASSVGHGLVVYRLRPEALAKLGGVET
jgi:hypothetical protein